MPREIKKVAVLGAGVMGKGISAHLAGAGLSVLMYDIVPPNLPQGTPRNTIAATAIEQLLAARPALIYSKKDASRITPLNLEDDLAQLAECDWIIEVVLEDLATKTKVFDKIEKYARPGTIITSNTSGIPLKLLAEGRSKDFRKHLFVTHFFNPVRYMRLLEFVQGPETDPQVVRFMADFVERVLGKGVVYCKDTPNFIANRIGVYGMLSVLHLMEKEGYTVEEVDKVLGPATAKSRGATLRTSDLVGLDTFALVAKNVYDRISNDEQHAAFQPPSFVLKMIEKKMLGDKSKQGFYKKVKNADGSSEIQALDLKTLTYRPQEKLKYACLKEVKNLECPDDRVRLMVNADDRAGKLAWTATADLLVYSANRVPEIAEDIVNIDNALKWGFNWELGPFETWDAIGVKEVVERLKKEGITKLPPIVDKVLAKGEGKFYRTVNGGREYFDFATESYKKVPISPSIVILSSLKDRNKVIQTNTGATLIDIGDGVACLEFHTKMNAIDDEVIAMGQTALEEVAKNFEGLVVSNEGENFSAGANLMLLMMSASENEWDKIKTIVRSFQNLTMAFRYSPKPVVAAPFGLALGGGCEVSMGCDKIRAHGELYMGLVEVGVGLLPAGGGCKEMVLRMDERLREPFLKSPIKWSKDIWWSKAPDPGPFPKVAKAFETIAFAKISTSAKEAQEIGYMKKSDGITLSRDHLIAAAKQDVLTLAKGYQQPKPREDILLPGQGGKTALLSSIRDARIKGQITEHDVTVASAVAHVLAGGDRIGPYIASEQTLLDLELEQFLILVGQEKTQARMQNMLMTGKPLRN